MESPLFSLAIKCSFSLEIFYFILVLSKMSLSKSLLNGTMNFTTLNVDPANELLSHPSMFQTPAIDIALTDNVSTAKLTDPSLLWQKQVSAAKSSPELSPQYSVPYDPKDPPLSDAERTALLTRFNPIINKNFTNVRPIILFSLFFSRQNIQTLQNEIRYAVNVWSGHHIGEQSTLELTILMEGIFSEHARPIDELNAPSKMLMRHLRTEIGRLDQLVVKEAVSLIVNALEQHLSYMETLDNPVTAKSLARPLDTKITGTMQYRSPTSLL
jgi:hypothetical protein